MKADADRKKDVLTELCRVPVVPQARVVATVVIHRPIVKA